MPCTHALLFPLEPVIQDLQAGRRKQVGVGTFLGLPDSLLSGDGRTTCLPPKIAA